MKKILLVAIMAMAGISLAVAQPRAIGGRLGYGLEISYQHSVGANMVQLEVGVPGFASLEAACTHDWIDPFNATVPWNQKGEWHWSLGVGGAIGGDLGFNAGYLGAVGRVGIEYDFWFPLQLSFDFRPMLAMVFNKDAVGFGFDGYAGAIGLGVRYLF